MGNRFLSRPSAVVPPKEIAMRRSTLLMAMATATALMVAGSLTSAAASNERVPDPANGHQALGRQILPANDGWASAQGGTTGGAAATLGHVYTVTNRSQLVAALLEAGDAPKIVYVKGSINANVDDANQPLSCADYAARTGYTLEKYMAAFDPTTWSWTADQASVEAACLLYTSDAADDLLCVDLGGRRI